MELSNHKAHKEGTEFTMNLDLFCVLCAFFVSSVVKDYFDFRVASITPLK